MNRSRFFKPGGFAEMLGFYLTRSVTVRAPRNRTRIGCLLPLDGAAHRPTLVRTDTAPCRRDFRHAGINDRISLSLIPPGAAQLASR